MAYFAAVTLVEEFFSAYRNWVGIGVVHEFARDSDDPPGSQMHVRFSEGAGLNDVEFHQRHIRRYIVEPGSLSEFKKTAQTER